jgi:hypothetical protein
MLAEAGSVLGIDVGFSVRRKSSAVCRLDWTQNSCSWTIIRFRAVEPERHDTIARAIADHDLEAVALDGPLRGALDVIGFYRTAERVLTTGFQRLIGKPGQSSSPVGKLLNDATNICARHALTSNQVREARHSGAVHPLALAEAFPSAYLGVMLAEPSNLSVRRGNRSDLYFVHAANNGLLARLFDHFLPSRQLAEDPVTITNHDDRAAFVCALTALGVAANDFIAVGDDNGRIVLPPANFIQPWAKQLLRANDVHLDS